MALANNLDVKIDAITPQIEQFRVRSAWGAFDPILSANMARESIDQPQNTQQYIATGGVTNEQDILIQQLANLNAVLRGDIKASDLPKDMPASRLSDEVKIFEEDNDRSQVSLDGKIPLGTKYRLFLSSNALENSLNATSSSTLFYPEYFSTAGVTLVQPLLKDFGPAANMAEIRIARKNQQIAVLNWKTQVITAVGSVMQDYYDMAAALENVRVKQDAIDLATTLKKENQRRLELGVMAPIDVQQAEAEVASREDELLTAKNLLLDRQNALKRLVLAEFQAGENFVFVPVDKLSSSAPALNRAQLMQTAFANRPDYQQALKQAEREEIRLRYVRNQLWPRIDLQGTYAVNGLGSGYGNSVSRAFDQQGPQWSAGFIFSMPIGNVQPRASLDIAKLQRQQAILNIQRTELQIGVDVDTVLSRLETNIKRVAASDVARRLAEEVLHVEEKHLEQGISTSFEVLTKQRDLSQARTRELVSVAEVSKTLVQLWVATGVLLDKQGIILTENNYSAEKRRQPPR